MGGTYALGKAPNLRCPFKPRQPCELTHPGLRRASLVLPWAGMPRHFGANKERPLRWGSTDHGRGRQEARILHCSQYPIRGNKIRPNESESNKVLRLIKARISAHASSTKVPVPKHTIRTEKKNAPTVTPTEMRAMRVNHFLRSEP